MFKNNEWSDGTYKESLLHSQMTTNSAVNRYLAFVINNKVRYSFCMINELLIGFKIKITDNFYNFIEK